MSTKLFEEKNRYIIDYAFGVVYVYDFVAARFVFLGEIDSFTESEMAVFLNEAE